MPGTPHKTKSLPSQGLCSNKVGVGGVDTAKKYYNIQGEMDTQCTQIYNGEK